MTLEALEHIAVIFGLLGGLFSFAVLRPLNNAIVKLEQMIEELRADMRRNEERWHTMSVKIAEVDQRARSAHHRLDDLVDICERTHDIKIPHPREQRSDGECKT